jgi:type IV pilus assembly protein PilC
VNVRWNGYDVNGSPARGVIDAPSIGEAREMLRKRGVFVSGLSEADAASDQRSDGTRANQSANASSSGGALGMVTSGWTSLSMAFGATSRLRSTGLMVRQLAVLVQTGTPLAESLLVLEKQIPDGPFREVMRDVRERVENGGTLNEAMASHPAWFGPVVTSLIAAGESRGKLADMLLRIATLNRQEVKVRQSLSGAMIYPSLLLFIAFIVVVAMVAFVMPRFEGMFENLGADLPPTTQMLMSASAFLRAWWWAVLLVTVPTGLGGLAWLLSESGRGLRDRALLMLPQIRGVARSLITARIARILGVLLEGRVTLVDALALTGASAGNSLYRTLLREAQDAVTRGESMCGALSDARLIPPSVCEAVRSGERSGQLAPVLLSVADFMDEDNEISLRTISSLIEPIILIVLGLVVGVIATSMFLPLFDLTSAGGGAGTPGGAP